MPDTYGWLYSDWRAQTDLAARLARLGLHLQEIEDCRDAIGSSGAETSVTFESLNDRLREMQGYWKELDETVRNKNRGPMHLIRPRRASR